MIWINFYFMVNQLAVDTPQLCAPIFICKFGAYSFINDSPSFFESI
jgi:hypothetical protein